MFRDLSTIPLHFNSVESYLSGFRTFTLWNMAASCTKYRPVRSYSRFLPLNDEGVVTCTVSDFILSNDFVGDQFRAVCYEHIILASYFFWNFILSCRLAIIEKAFCELGLTWRNYGRKIYFTFFVQFFQFNLHPVSDIAVTRTFPFFQLRLQSHWFLVWRSIDDELSYIFKNAFLVWFQNNSNFYWLFFFERNV